MGGGDAGGTRQFWSTVRGMQMPMSAKGERHAPVVHRVSHGAAIGWLRAHGLVLACGVAAALPVVIAGVHALVVGWYP